MLESDPCWGLYKAAPSPKAQAAPCVLAPSCPVRGAGAATAPGTGLPPSDPTPHLLLLSVGPSSLRAQTAWAAAGEPPGCQSPARGWPAAAAHSGPGPLELTKPPLDGRAGGTGPPRSTLMEQVKGKNQVTRVALLPLPLPRPRGSLAWAPVLGLDPLLGSWARRCLPPCKSLAHGRPITAQGRGRLRPIRVQLY